MEVQYLVYKGPKDDGYITVSKEPATSKFRRLHVYQGMRLLIGKEVPQLTAKRVMDNLSGSFVIEKHTLDELETFKAQFSEIVQSYKDQFGDDAISVVPALVIEGLFGIMGDEAMEAVLTALKESEEIEMDIPEIKKMVADVFKLEKRTVKKKSVTAK